MARPRSAQLDNTVTVRNTDPVGWAPSKVSRAAPAPDRHRRQRAVDWIRSHALLRTPTVLPFRRVVYGWEEQRQHFPFSTTATSRNPVRNPCHVPEVMPAHSSMAVFEPPLPSACSLMPACPSRSSNSRPLKETKREKKGKTRNPLHCKLSSNLKTADPRPRRPV
ncbi:hypothetical protein VTK26DRAFT_4538 [Humicola hyalothermophila]